MGVVYERLLGAIGTERFGTTVRDSVLSLTAGARRIYLFEVTGREDSSLQYFFGEPGLVELFPAYRRWYVRQDPLCDACVRRPSPVTLRCSVFGPRISRRRDFGDDSSMTPASSNGFPSFNVARTRGG